jgi:MFS superfamily sulfate permease-like transporter
VVLAAIVLVSISGLLDVKALLRLAKISRGELAVCLVAMVGVLLLGVLKGVLLAVIVSLLMLLVAEATPHVAILGRIPGTARYSDLERHPDNERPPGVLVFRIEAPLLYFNVDHVRGIVRNKIAETASLWVVVCDLSNSPYVDVAGAEMLRALHQDLATRGVRFRIVEPHARVRDLLRRADLEDEVGYFGRHLSIDQAIREVESTREGREAP